MLDALLPELEGIMEVEGWLIDITDQIKSSTPTDAESLSILAPPGTVIKLTAAGQLFDVQYLAQAFGSFSISVSAVQALTQLTSKLQRQPQPRQSVEPKSETEQHVNLEDVIENFSPEEIGTAPEELRSIVKLARGMFGGGLHLLFPRIGNYGWTLTARLQEGKKYLDADRDILFARYGTSPQRWTILGSVGHYSQRPTPAASEAPNFLHPDGTINRNEIVSNVNAALLHFASRGLVDSPAFPGISLIPIAVYRSIPLAGNVSRE